MQTTIRYELRGDVKEDPDKTSFYPFTVQLQPNSSLAAAVSVARILTSRADLVGNLHVWEFTDKIEQAGRRVAVNACSKCGGLCTDMNLRECCSESPDPTRVPKPVAFEAAPPAEKSRSKRRPAVRK